MSHWCRLSLGRVNTLTSFHWFHIFFLNTKLLKGSTVSHRENMRFPHSCSNPLIFLRAGKLLFFTYCYCRASFLCDNGCVDGLLCDGRGAVFGSAWHPAIDSASYSSYSGIIIDNSKCDRKTEASSLQCQRVSNHRSLGKDDWWIVQFASVEKHRYTVWPFVTVNNKWQLSVNLLL